MHNIEMAWIFHELADMLEFKGEDFFKIRAYRRAAKILTGLNEPVAELYRRGELVKIPGIGKNILAKIGELLSTGKMKKHQELSHEIPRGLLEIMDLPGIGPKRARFLYESLHITSLEELEEAARKCLVRELPGMGAKTEQDIIRNIEMLRRRSDKVLLGVARELAYELLDYLASAPGVKQLTITGSVRRWRETVGDIDLLVAATDPTPVFSSLLNHPRTREVLILEEDRVKVFTWWGIPVELIVVPPENYWSTLLWTTGSKKHYQHLQLLAWQKGWELNQYGLATQNGKHRPAIQTEEEIYQHLALPFIPPELREGRGEIEFCLREGKLPSLVEPGEIKGDLHIHSNWSDGTCSIEEIVERARKKGYNYVAITDHSPSLKVAKGLSIERLYEKDRFIKEMNKKLKNFHILSGVEVDILPQGGLDYPEEVLKEMDLVIASIHSAFRQDRETMTSRILNAVKNEHVDVIGHLTGRLLGQREAYALDVEKVLKEAAKHGKILEINAAIDRLDLNEEHARLAKKYGVKMVINTDAHDLHRLDEMPYGVAIARRAWLEPSDIINTLDLPELMELLGSCP